MALPPKFAGAKLLLNSSPAKAINTVELYLDYVCPFSAKMFKTFYKSFMPTASTKSYASNVQFIFRQQVQPWHPTSTLVHEAGVVVLSLAPNRFWEFSEKLFERQTEYFDVNVVNETRNATYKRLAKLGASVGIEESKMYSMLQIPDKPDKDGNTNIGNEVTNDFKTVIKMARLTGVHVSPTVIFNGVVENGISSSFTTEQWDKWLEEHCS